MKNAQFKDRYHRAANAGVGKFVRKQTNKKIRREGKVLLDDAPRKVAFSGWYH